MAGSLLRRQFDDRQGEANALGNLGVAYDALGQTQQVIEFYQQSLEISQQIGDRRGVAIAWFNLGVVLKEIELEQLEQALSAFKAARSLYLDMGFQQDVKDCDAAIARLQPGTGDAIADPDASAES